MISTFKVTRGVKTSLELGGQLCKVKLVDWSASRATPVVTARAEDPGLSEAAEAVPTESVRSKRKSKAYLRLTS